MLNAESAAHFVTGKTAHEMAEAMLRGANAPDVVASLTLVIEAYGREQRERCAALAERLGTRWIDTPMDAYNACLGVAGHIRALDDAAR